MVLKTQRRTMFPPAHAAAHSPLHDDFSGGPALAERQLADLFENAAIGLAWLDAEGRLLKANRAQLELLGRAADECLGRKLQELNPDPAAVEALLKHLSERGWLRDFQMRLNRPDDSFRHVVADGRAFRQRGRLTHAVLFFRDITARVELQLELLETSEREQQRMGRELHDSLGQHLHAVYYFACLLRQNLAERALPQVKEASRLSFLLEEALEMTRGVAQGLQPVESVPEGLMVALKELAERTRILYRVNCRFHCLREVLVAHNAVATHLYRIAQEAVRNSLQHARPTRVEIALHATANNLVLRIRDNGRGFGSPTRGATGMGLKNMHYRAGVIGGGLTVRQRPRGGTEVLCSVPLVSAYPH